jgi:type II secretory pathway pseudopilin PulG
MRINYHNKFVAGFTLVEVIISVGILTMLSAMIIVNYRRGNDDSALNREIAVLMSNIRLAQEQTAGGLVTNHCSVYTGQACTGDSDCASGGGVCVPDPVNVPYGGYAVAFSCQDIPGGINYPLAYNGKTQYGVFAENRSCALNAGAGCFPVQAAAVDPEVVTGVTDGRVSYVGTLATGYFGDTLQNFIKLKNKIEIKNIKLTSFDNSTVKCGEDSPWLGRPVPDTGSTVAALYPIQALIRFIPPDGRTTAISDNIAAGKPTADNKVDSAKLWVKAEIILGVEGRLTDCRTVMVTDAGMVSQRMDASCDFSS